jgi:hypothetical protein
MQHTRVPKCWLCVYGRTNTESWLNITNESVRILKIKGLYKSDVFVCCSRTPDRGER